ncbi:tautomerase family protein [Bosea sp. NPDC055332]
MPSIRIEAGAGLQAQRPAVMLAVSQACLAPLGVHAGQNDVVMTCHGPGDRLVGEGRSESFCRIEIYMLAGRDPAQKAGLRSAIALSLAPFGIADDDLKLIVTDVPPANLGR